MDQRADPVAFGESGNKKVVMRRLRWIPMGDSEAARTDGMLHDGVCGGIEDKQSVGLRLEKCMCERECV